MDALGTPTREVTDCRRNETLSTSFGFRRCEAVYDA